MRFLTLLIAVFAAIATLCAEDIPDDAQKAIAVFEKGATDADAKTTDAVAKHEQVLKDELRKIIEKETKAHHSDNVRRLKDYLEDPANKSTADLPDTAAEAIAERERKVLEIQTKASNESMKRQGALAKSLQRVHERETKAGHIEAAALVKQYLDTHVDKGLAAKLAAGTPGENPAWPDFLSSLRVISDAKGATAAITIGDWSLKKPAKGMNVVAMVDGKRVIEGTFSTAIQYQALADQLEKLPPGAYVVAAIMQGTMTGATFPPTVQKMLRTCGAKRGLEGEPAGTSYVLIGAKGMPSSQAIEKVQVDRIAYPFAAKK